LKAWAVAGGGVLVVAILALVFLRARGGEGPGPVTASVLASAAADPPAPPPAVPAPPPEAVDAVAAAPSGQRPFDRDCPRSQPASGERCEIPIGQVVTCPYTSASGSVACSCQATAETPAPVWKCTSQQDLPKIAKCPEVQPTTGETCSPVGMGCVSGPRLEEKTCKCIAGEPSPTWKCGRYKDVR
jgi:hypothetical protein